MPNPHPTSGTVVAGAADDLSPPVKVSGVDASGNIRTLAVDTDGAMGAPATNATVVAYAASKIGKAASGKLYGLTGYNAKTSTQFIQLHDSATLPAEAAVPVVIFSVAASSPFSLDYGARGRSFTTGIVVCNSSTGPTKTIGSADCWFDLQVG